MITRLILAALLGLVAATAAAHERPTAPAVVQTADAATASAIAVVDAFHEALRSGEADAVPLKVPVVRPSVRIKAMSPSTQAARRVTSSVVAAAKAMSAGR